MTKKTKKPISVITDPQTGEVIERVIRCQGTYYPMEKDKEYPSSVSMVEPDESLSIGEILERSERGIQPPFIEGDIGDDDDNLDHVIPNFDDVVDMQQYIKELELTLEAAQKEQEQRDQASEKDAGSQSDGPFEQDVEGEK